MNRRTVVLGLVAGSAATALGGPAVSAAPTILTHGGRVSWDTESFNHPIASRLMKSLSGELSRGVLGVVDTDSTQRPFGGECLGVILEDPRVEVRMGPASPRSTIQTEERFPQARVTDGGVELGTIYVHTFYNNLEAEEADRHSLAMPHVSRAALVEALCGEERLTTDWLWNPQGVL